jgi:hypothetical protein
MLSISAADVVADPFPHVIKQGILPDDVFAALKADFPSQQVFSGQRDRFGKAGSRTGKGSDIYRGDAAFGELVARSPAWRDFADYINSERFLDTFREVFAGHLDDMGLRVDLGKSRVQPDYVEPREVLTEHATPLDSLVHAAAPVLEAFSRPKGVDLFTRLDIHSSSGGYLKPPHCDRPNRLCSLIVYFTDAEAIGMEGGELQIFKHAREKKLGQYERHPHPENVQEVARLKPKPNLGVLFPCQNNSYHGVTAVTSEGLARDFLYINISGLKRSLW